MVHFTSKLLFYRVYVILVIVDFLTT